MCQVLIISRGAASTTAQPRRKLFRARARTYSSSGGELGRPGAMFFSKQAGRVFILCRGSDLRKSMSDYLVRQIEDMDNIEVLLDTGVVSVEGEDHLERITAKNTATGETETATAHSLFVFI